MEKSPAMNSPSCGVSSEALETGSGVSKAAQSGVCTSDIVDGIAGGSKRKRVGDASGKAESEQRQGSMAVVELKGECRYPNPAVRSTASFYSSNLSAGITLYLDLR